MLFRENCGKNLRWGACGTSRRAFFATLQTNCQQSEWVLLLFFDVLHKKHTHGRISLKRVWKLFAMIIGFILPTNKTLYDALEKYIATAYFKISDEKVKKNIRYAYNRLVHSYPRGERKYLPSQEEAKYLQVPFSSQYIKPHPWNRNTKVIQSP